MAVNPIPGNQAQITPKMMAEAVLPNAAPAALQAMAPQDTLGIKTKQEPRKGLSASSRLSDLKPEELSSLGGGGALETIASAQPSTTVGEVGPLLKNKAALDGIAGLMENRKDLKVGDFVSRDQKGRTRIDPSYKDPKTLEMLKERPDITPSQLTAMRQNMTKTLKNPQLGKQAAEKSFELLKKRTDLKPEDMGKMLGSLRQAAGGDKNSQKSGGAGEEAGAMAALDMFDSASKLMEKRTDLNPERMGELAQSVGNLSSPKDKNGPQSVAEGFEAASKGLEKNVLRKPEDMSKMASTMTDHFKGGDEKTAGHRMNAFKKSADMMGENTSVDHNSINKMLTQATQRDPKLKHGEGAAKAKRLGKVMDDVTTGVKSGTVDANDLSSHFRNQDAEKARFAPEKPEKKKAQEQKKQDKVEGKKDDDKSAAPDKDKSKTEKTPGQVGEAKSEKSKAEPGKTELGKSKEGESKKDKTVLTQTQVEEQGAQPPSAPGSGPNIDPKLAATAGPGEAAGTKSAGTAPGTSPKNSTGGIKGGPGVTNLAAPVQKKQG